MTPRSQVRLRGAHSATTARKRWLGLSLLLAVVATILYFMHDGHNDKASVARTADVLTTAPVRRTVATKAATVAAQHTARLNHQAKRHTVDAEHPPSHPLDPQRQRIYRENNFHASMMSAMNQGDVDGLRALVEDYRLAYPEDEFDLQDGYTVIADCLDRLTAERQERARHYWRTNRSSLVRRFIRRHCLEQPVLAG
jgi:hypothetical protein